MEELTQFEFVASEYVKLVAKASRPIYKGLSGEDGPVFFKVDRVTGHSVIEIGGFAFHTFPWCGSVVISGGSYLTKETQHSGLSDPFRKLKENIARDLGFSMMVCTLDMANVPAIGNAMKSKYRIETFKGTEGNLLGFGTKKLN
jgi:hypothetical protein